MYKSYPKIVYQTVLLYENKIVNWKTGNTVWCTVNDAFNNRQPRWLLEEMYPDNYYVLCKENFNKLTTAIRAKQVYSIEENNKFFRDNTWFLQWPLHEKFHGFKPY